MQEIYKYINDDYCLVIQWDGFVINPNCWNNIFFDYDYIGAPWPDKPENMNVGNGGFSLRSKKLIEWTSTLTDWTGQNEDTFIVSTKKSELESQGLKIAPVEVATQFSVENEMTGDHGLHNVFGFHAKNKMELALEKIRQKI